MIIDPFLRREIGSCFYLVIPICETDDEFAQLMADANKVQSAVKSMLDGKLNPEELLESVEAFVPDIDEYIDEVEENLEAIEPLIYGC